MPRPSDQSDSLSLSSDAVSESGINRPPLARQDAFAQIQSKGSWLLGREGV